MDPTIARLEPVRRFRVRRGVLGRVPKTSVWGQPEPANFALLKSETYNHLGSGFWGRLRKRSGLKNLSPVSDKRVSQLWGAVKTRRIDETSLLPSGRLPGLCSHISLSFHRVKCGICFAQEALNRITVFGIDCDPDADGKLWPFAVIGNAFANT